MLANAEIPSHVPQDLVSSFNFWTAKDMAPTPGGDPHLSLSALRKGPRIFYSPNNTRDGQGTWVLTSIDDMRTVLRDTETFSSHRSIFASALGENWPLIPLEIDPPDHSTFRKLLNPLFSPQRMEKLEAQVRQRAIDLIESFKDKGSCEVMSEFAFPYAVSIFLEFLGLPKERMKEFLGWATNLLHPATPQHRTDAAMEVIAARVAEWGLLPVTAEEALDADRGGQHRRYMVHGTSHHLGIDVHDCAQARREMYYDGLLEPGMVFTIEPGLYFQIDDLTVPEEYRGIGVRIEDDVLVTEDGVENLSAAIPRTADEVEAWIARATS